MSDERNSLESLIDGAQPASTPEPVEARSEPVETGDKPTAEAPPAAAPSEPSDVVGLRAALQAERRQKQENARRLQELEAQIQAVNQQRQQPQPKAEEPQQPQIDWWMDPEGAARYVQEQLQQQFQHQLFETRFEFGLAQVQDKEDFNDATAAFAQVARQDQRLGMAYFTHKNPAKFAYEQGRKILAYQRFSGDPDAYEAKLREEIEAKIRAEQQGRPQDTPSPKSRAPTSLAGTTSTQPRNNRGQFASGPVALEDIIGN